MRIQIFAITLVVSLGSTAIADELVDDSTLTIVVSSTSPSLTEVVQPIELPAGMTATGLRVSIGGHDSGMVVTASREARGTYDAIVARIKDPALLEYRDERHAILRVFPVRRGSPATVVVELTPRSLANADKLPHLDRHVSLLALPVDTEQYASYWPAHVALVPDVAELDDDARW